MRPSTRKVSPDSTTKFYMSHFNMMTTVVNMALAAANVAVTQSITAFYNVILGIQSNQSAIEILRTVTRSPITGYAEQKKVTRIALAALSSQIMNAAYGYAIATGNMVLAGQMKNAASRLGRGGATEMNEYVMAAIANVTPLASAGTLTPYNVTTTVVGVWTSLQSQYGAILSSPQNARANRVAANDSIQALLHESMVSLTNNGDTLALQFQTSNANYFSNYWASRRLNTHTLSTQLRLWVADSAGDPITRGEAFILGTDRSAELTNNNGYVLIDEIPFGSHQVSFTAISGTAIYGPFDFKKGQSLTLHVVFNQTAPSKSSVTSKTEEVLAETSVEK